MKRKLSKIYALSIGVCLCFGLATCNVVTPGTAQATETVAKADGLHVQIHTPEQIRAHSGQDSFETVYAKEPITKNPYEPGALSNETLNNALNTLNLMRYIAGIPDNVTLNKSYNEYAQAGSLVNNVNGVMTHTPEKPVDMEESLYKTGYTGTSSSNLGAGYSSLYSAIVEGWMNDSDTSNVDRVGHRRWILNPSMQQTGFGMVEFDSAMYAFDNCFGNTEYSNVAWPAQNMPVEYFGENYAWSVSVGQEVPNDVKVKLTRKNDGKIWEFSNNNGVFYINNQNYGQKGCIIFQPKGVSYNPKDSFEVSIIGTDINIKYNVNFFAMNPTTSVTLNHDKLTIEEQKKEYLTATVQPAINSNQTRWTTSNPAVATVSSYGCVTGVSEGTAVITCTCGEKSASCNVTVKKPIKALSNATIKLSGTTFDYTGSAIKPSVTVQYAGKTLTENVDYSVSYANNINAGTGKVTITGMGNYSETIGKEFTIKSKTLTLATVSNIDPQTYTSSAITPNVIISLGGHTLTKDVDYKISCTNNINVGNGTVIITGIGNYSGTIKKDFSIISKSLEHAVFNAIETKTYTGSAIMPDVILSLDGHTLIKNIDYKVDYVNNINAGYGKVVITGLGNYSGMTEKEFKIAPKTLDSAIIKTIKTQSYTGTKLTPDVVILMDEIILTNGVDYNIEYSNNINAGKGKVTITGIRNYTGFVDANFTIKKAIQKLKMTNTKKTWKQSELHKKNKQLKLKAISNISTKISYCQVSATSSKIKTSAKGVVTIGKNIKKGTYKVKVKVMANKTVNYSKAEKVFNIVIKIK